MMTAADFKKRSKIIAQMADEGKIKVVGAYYSLETGEVKILGSPKRLMLYELFIK